MSIVAKLLLFSALVFGFTYTLFAFFLWVEAALAPGSVHCVSFSSVGWIRWIEHTVEPFFLGGILLVELWAIWLVIQDMRTQLRDKS